MNETVFCQVHIKGHFSNQWSDWFFNLNIDNQPEDEAILYGWLPDQGAFFGVMEHIRDLGMKVIYVEMLGRKKLPLQEDATHEQLPADSSRIL